MSTETQSKLPIELIQRLAEGHNPAYGVDGSYEPDFDYEEIITSLSQHVMGLVAENVALKKNLIFWDADNPELPYESPEEIASECSINYNEEFEVQVAARMPNRVYRVSESWEHDCKVELVEGQEMKAPSTDAFTAELRAHGMEMLKQRFFTQVDLAVLADEDTMTVFECKQAIEHCSEELTANLRAGRKG